MQRYIFTMGLDTVNPAGVLKYSEVFRREIKPIFDENETGCAFLTIEEMKATYILYADGEMDIAIFGDLKDKYKIVIEPFEDIKQYNGFVFKHNKADIEEFLESIDAVSDWSMNIAEDENSFIELNITRYNDTEIEGYINEGFDYSIEVSREMVEKFAEKYGFEIVE